MKVSNPVIVEKRRQRVPKSPVSPQVENIEGERENNNWITKEWMRSGWMDGETTHLFTSAAPVGREKESKRE